jgi:hypothetical protein
MRSIIIGAALMLAGCATITEGNTQDVTVLVTPAKATCEAKRDVYSFGTFTGPKHVLNVVKTQKPLAITCSAPGYKTETVEVRGTPSKMAIAGAAITSASLAVDVIAGSAFKLPEEVRVDLKPGR